jgi:hypothetical protein
LRGVTIARHAAKTLISEAPIQALPKLYDYVIHGLIDGKSATGLLVDHSRDAAILTANELWPDMQIVRVELEGDW